MKLYRLAFIVCFSGCIAYPPRAAPLYCRKNVLSYALDLYIYKSSDEYPYRHLYKHKQLSIYFRLACTNINLLYWYSIAKQ